MRKQIHKAIDYIVYLIVRIAICVVQSLSLSQCERGSEILAFVFNDVLRVRRKLTDTNLRFAFPEKSEHERNLISRGMWRHLFLLASEAALAPRQLHVLNWHRHVMIENGRALFKALQADRPIILITAHFGNFELGGFLLGLLGYPTFSVARELDNGYLNDFVSDFRGQTGQYIIDKNTGYEDILSVLRSNGVMAFLADQSAGRKGAWVKFFNRPASAYKAMALLSVEYDAPIFVCYATRRNDQPLSFTMRLVDSLDPRELPEDVQSIQQITQWHVTRLEEQIRLAPDQYWWLHNRWKTYGKSFPSDWAQKH
ncbi:MAG: lysophospholipid acyltransferase family protein [Planctomycetia bacterium]|nr:lysophospholipid acyltransferase family protein [Planctomycetia bacterium]